jgi:hypothetical protein
MRATEPRQGRKRSLLAPLVNEVLNTEAADRDALAQFADIGHGSSELLCGAGPRTKNIRHRITPLSKPLLSLPNRE